MSFNGVSSSFWDEPEYITETHQNVAGYIFGNMDHIGVCPMNLSSVSKRCRISKNKLLKTLEYFQDIDKLLINEKTNHIWWKSGCFHKLFRGKYSKNQLKSVQKLLRKHHFSGVFGESFAKTVSQHYGTKYNLEIPIADYIYINTYTNTYVYSKGEKKEQPTNYDPETIKKIHKIEYDKSKKPIDNLMAWNKTKEADDMHEALKMTPNFEVEWVEFEWLQKFIPEVTIKPDWAFDALFNYHNGSWRDMFWSWLKRGIKFGSRDKFYQGRIK